MIASCSNVTGRATPGVRQGLGVDQVSLQLAPAAQPAQPEALHLPRPRQGGPTTAPTVADWRCAGTVALAWQLQWPVPGAGGAQLPLPPVPGRGLEASTAASLGGHAACGSAEGRGANGTPPLGPPPPFGSFLGLRNRIVGSGATSLGKFGTIEWA